MDLAQLQARRNELAAQMRSHAEENFHKKGKKWDAEGRQKWEQLNKDYNEVLAQMEEARAADDVRRQLEQLDEFEERSVNDRKPGRDDEGRERRRRERRKGGNDSNHVTAEDRALALQAWCRMQMDGELTERQAAAAKKVGINPRARTLNIDLASNSRQRAMQRHFRTMHPSLAEERALSAVAGSDGGATVAPAFIDQLEVNMLAFSGMLQVADTLTTATGADLPWPTADDTDNEGEIIGENQVQNEAEPSFGAVVWKAYKFSSKLVRVPTELLEDSAFDLASELGRMLGERLGRVQNRKYTVGTGGSEPAGILNKATLGHTTAGSTAITDAEIVTLIHKLDPAYRTGAAFMAHDNVYLAIRLLKGLDGQFIWQQGLQLGQPDRLAGYPTFVNQHMPDSLIAGNKSILFGQLNKYKVRRVRGIRLRRLVERYADQDQEGFVAFLRADGNLLDAGTAPVVYLLQKP